MGIPFVFLLAGGVGGGLIDDLNGFVDCRERHFPPLIMFTPSRRLIVFVFPYHPLVSLPLIPTCFSLSTPLICISARHRRSFPLPPLLLLCRLGPSFSHVH